MQTIKTRALVEADGELHLAGLPCKQGNYVDVMIQIPEQRSETDRQEALRRFQERADKMQFKSNGPYPSRDELHERH